MAAPGDNGLTLLTLKGNQPSLQLQRLLSLGERKQDVYRLLTATTLGLGIKDAANVFPAAVEKPRCRYPVDDAITCRW